MTIVVMSQLMSVPPVMIDVQATNWRRAKRQALFIARRQNVPAPHALTEREAALAIRRMAAAMRQPMPGLNGCGKPFWAAPTRIADCYDER